MKFLQQGGKSRWPLWQHVAEIPPNEVSWAPESAESEKLMRGRRKEASLEEKGGGAGPVAVLARRHCTTKLNLHYHMMTRAPSSFTLPAMSFRMAPRIVAQNVSRSFVLGALWKQAQEGELSFNASYAVIATL